MINPTDWRLWYCYYFISEGKDEISLSKAIQYAPNELKDDLLEQKELPIRIDDAHNQVEYFRSSHNNFIYSNPVPNSEKEEKILIGVLFFGVLISLIGINVLDNGGPSSIFGGTIIMLIGIAIIVGCLFLKDKIKQKTKAKLKNTIRIFKILSMIKIKAKPIIMI